MVSHPNAKTIWTTIEVEGGQPKTVVIVETDLILNSADEKFDGQAVDDLVEACINYFELNKRTVDRVTLKSILPG